MKKHVRKNKPVVSVPKAPVPVAIPVTPLHASHPDWAPMPPPFVPKAPPSRADIKADIFQLIREFTSEHYEYLPDQFVLAVLAL